MYQTDHSKRGSQGEVATRLAGTERHALGALASLEVSPELTLGAQWVQSPVDGSGVVAPSATVVFGDKVSLVATAYVPYGRRPRGGELRSFYGATPLSGYLQLRVYE